MLFKDKRIVRVCVCVGGYVSVLVFCAMKLVIGHQARHYWDIGVWPQGLLVIH